jgi:molybdopterin molybdotransferase
MNQFEPTISLEEAFRIADETMADTKPTGERIPVRSAVGRALIADQRSELDLPPFDKAAMDGYAALAGDERDEYTLLETVPAGHVGTQTLTPGTAVKVMTGAPVPEGTGRVIMLEHTEEHADRVRILKHDGVANICRKGEDVRVGDVVLSAGTLLGPLEVANLVACGITEVEVARRPRVAVLSTGDEIVDSPDALSPGKIMNSNGPMLAALAEQHGMEVICEQSVPDDKEATEAAIAAAVGSSDITILSGGVSVGEYDYVLGALAAAGLTVRFSRIAAQPGKPTVYATGCVGAIGLPTHSACNRVVFGLPGNPVSVFLMFHLFVLRAADWMTGRRPEMRQLVLPLASPFKRRKADRVSFVPARMTERGEVEPVTFHGSAHLAALMSADGFMRVPVGVTELAGGDEVAFLPIIGSVR